MVASVGNFLWVIRGHALRPENTACPRWLRRSVGEMPLERPAGMGCVVFGDPVLGLFAVVAQIPEHPSIEHAGKIGTVRFDLRQQGV